MRELIKNELLKLQAEHDVSVLWAIESGSRSWGFQSPDSDYDVRFIYVNRPDWYLSIDEKRDVIELPITEVLDISGWDLRKTLRLFKKSNPVLMEWLVSPYVYLQQGDFRDQLLDSASTCFSRKASAYHYLKMAENNYRRNVQSKDPVILKKYFYVLRPLFNIIWLKQNDTIPPMIFTDTLNVLDVPADVKQETFQLLEIKKQSSEIGTGPHIPILDDFIQQQLDLAADYCLNAPTGSVTPDELDNLFRQTIENTW